MSIESYLDALDDKLRELEGLVITRSIRQEIDINLGIGFIKGQIGFIDGSKLDFSEQLPTDRRKYRFHYIDSQNELIARWDSAPHHKELSTFPFHKHSVEGIKEHKDINLIDTLEEIAKKILSFR